MAEIKEINTAPIDEYYIPQQELVGVQQTKLIQRGRNTAALHRQHISNLNVTLLQSPQTPHETLQPPEPKRQYILALYNPSQRDLYHPSGSPYSAPQPIGTIRPTGGAGTEVTCRT